MTLNELKTGQSARIINIEGKGELRRHLLDMGLTPGTIVTLRKKAPMGDPIEFMVRGYVLTLRLSEAENIEIEHMIISDECNEEIGRYRPIEHPRVGELGKAQS